MVIPLFFKPSEDAPLSALCWGSFKEAGLTCGGDQLPNQAMAPPWRDGHQPKRQSAVSFTGSYAVGTR